MASGWRGTLRAAAVAAACVLAPAIAIAQATVDVEVRDAHGAPVEGTVTLVPRAEGETRRCETREGRCTIDAVAGGRHVVRFAPRAGGEAPPERAVMIPPSGRVRLIVATGP